MLKPSEEVDVEHAVMILVRKVVDRKWLMNVGVPESGHPLSQED